LSLFERQEIELKNEPFDLGMLVEEILASMRLQFEKYKAIIVFSPLGEDYRLRADKLHITSVIFNLLDNALKYSRHNPSIRVELGTAEDQLVLSVTDNGLGIPLIYRERIFEKFFRVPTGDRHDVKGYGLGLSYVSYVVGRQGGTITVDSQEGIGSRFTVKIPRNHV
jgi:two-component system phosphate regulon sensor histidine kinase PhoR